MVAANGDADHGFARLGGPGRRGSRAGGDRTAIDGLLNDLRFSARSLLHRPGFAAIALITLAVGIGANVAMFSLVKATLLQSLGYGEPEQLVTLHSAIAREGIEFGQTSMADFLDIRERNRAFEAVALWSFRSASVATDEGAVWISGVAATTNIFDLLQVRPLLGSTFAIGDDGPDGPRNVMISEGLWNTLFGGRAEAIGEVAASRRRRVHGGRDCGRRRSLSRWHATVGAAAARARERAALSASVLGGWRA